MKITIDLSDELFRQAKTRAVLDGIKLEELIIHFVQQGLRQGVLSEAPLRRWRSELPVAREATGRTLPNLSNAELSILEEEEEIAVTKTFQNESDQKTR